MRVNSVRLETEDQTSNPRFGLFLNQTHISYTASNLIEEDLICLQIQTSSRELTTLQLDLSR